MAILRGINVGGKRKIKMVDLKTHLSSLNFSTIETYIQSGNIVFQADKAKENILAQQIEEKIKIEYDFDVPTIVKKAQALKDIFQNNPFLQTEEEIDIKNLHATFLAEEVSEELLHQVQAIQDEPNRLHVTSHVVYLFCPKYRETKFTNGFFEKKLKVKATTRNWKTVSKLMEMMSK